MASNPRRSQPQPKPYMAFHWRMQQPQGVGQIDPTAQTGQQNGHDKPVQKQVPLETQEHVSHELSRDRAENYDALKHLETIIIRQARCCYVPKSTPETPNTLQIVTYLTDVNPDVSSEPKLQIDGADKIVALLIMHTEDDKPWAVMVRSEPRRSLRDAYEELLRVTQRDMRKFYFDVDKSGDQVPDKKSDVTVGGG
ncbi:uncharacterized protein K460DRAFT_398942 [Cucurbitaria berberidis CBS 394.84]|uniref:Uncharacterized protein n=1 Tax=Cucurbitaria berberidis CBS 394.84 TaxID=1168544 RepID=A0A9P4G8T5_9PLEO|nr:uncharacterized protein K460DRAFT_398942 [Cucurbitaria berberidis CBS 394.84]KAF1841079.1 hypothetical protein K460DRAFT_398942 [Cucurbitaria berberidis CBS 394.84]